jgi:O-antigen ligase
MMRFLNNLSFNSKRFLFLLTGILTAILIAISAFNFGIITPIIVILLSGLVLLLIINFNNPRTTLYVLLSYCFTIGLVGREIGGDIPYGILIEVFIVLAWIVALIKVPINQWKVIQPDLFYLLLFWFLLSVIQIINPAGASVMGWLQEIRSAALYPILIVPITYLLFNTNKDLDTFLKIVIFFSVLSALNGIKQLHLGLSAGEQLYLDANSSTHMLYGHLRVFSFYSDAGQFGASQAHICLVSFLLALGPIKWWKRLLLLASSGLMFYGMLISGTRGALFALIVGVFVAIVLSKRFKIMLVGGAIALSCLFILKFTYLGNTNYQIYRLRTAVDPDDPSLKVRLNSQRILKEYMSRHPFGGGLGVIGNWGIKYNSDKFLSTIPPDSYWVKVWAMYGIVGFTIWFGIMMYILGKCCGIVWKLNDPGLRVKAIALTSGYAGILFCSYGNEVINTMPSSIIVYMSWVFVFICPRLDQEILKRT